MDELKLVANNLIKKMQEDPILSQSVSLCVINFNRYADCYLDFLDVNEIDRNLFNSLKAQERLTSVGEALEMALERLSNQISLYDDREIEYFSPTIIFISDGIPTDRRKSKQLAKVIFDKSKEGEISVIPINVGRKTESEWLKGLNKDNKVYHLKKDKDYEDLFSRISSSIKLHSQVIPLDEDNIDNDEEIEFDDFDIDSTIYHGTSNKSLDDFITFNFLNKAQFV